MTIKLAFDFDLPERKRQAEAVCGRAFAHQVVLPDEAVVVIVGEHGKCQRYLNQTKTVVFWPNDDKHLRLRAKGRSAVLAGKRLFVVGSEKTPEFFDAVIAAMSSVK